MRALGYLLNILIVPLALFCCSNLSEGSEGGVTYETDYFSLQYPSHYSIIEDKGIDSHVFRLEDKKTGIIIRFDFGYYSSPPPLTPWEYALKGKSQGASDSFFIANSIPMNKENFNKINLSKIDTLGARDTTGGFYLATYKFEKSIFKAQVWVPNDFKNYQISLDTTEKYIKRLVIPKNPLKDPTEAYYTLLTSGDSLMNAPLVLKIRAQGISSEKQTEILNIFKTIKIK